MVSQTIYSLGEGLPTVSGLRHLSVQFLSIDADIQRLELQYRTDINRLNESRIADIASECLHDSPLGDEAQSDSLAMAIQPAQGHARRLLLADRHEAGEYTHK
jgi:hypothetical protein